jgi:hypothetical protein
MPEGALAQYLLLIDTPGINSHHLSGLKATSDGIRVLSAVLCVACYVVLCVLCCAVSCCAVAVLCYVVLCCAVSFTCVCTAASLVMTVPIA